MKNGNCALALSADVSRLEEKKKNDVFSLSLDNGVWS